MNDYSEVTCHLQKDVVNLINALNDKKWKDANNISWEIYQDIAKLALWLQERKYEPK